MLLQIEVGRFGGGMAWHGMAWAWAAVTTRTHRTGTKSYMAK